MSIRFRILNVSAKSEKEGDTFIRFSGKSEPYNQSSERECSIIAEDFNGNKKYVFNTGLDPEKVNLYRWYTEEEQQAVKQQIEEALPLIEKAYGGKDAIEETNYFFWKKKKEVNKFVVTHEIENFEFDTKNAAHLLLYLSIISGAFMDVVAPTREWAERHGILHYLNLETEENQFDGEDELTESDAIAALSKLKNDGDLEGLFILAWCLQYDTTAFGAYGRNNKIKNLALYHIKYIKGQLKSRKRKINFPAKFLEYFKKWEGQQTKAQLYVEAYAKAGEYYSFINANKEKKYQTVDGVVLGTTIMEVAQNLNKNKFADDLAKLRDLVEAKWKE